MTSKSVEDWINSCLKLITHETFDGCKQVTDLVIEPLTDQKVVIVSDIFRVSFTIQYKNGDRRTLKTVYKTEPTNEGFLQMVKDLGIADNEFLVYNLVLKEMEKLMDTKPKTGELPWPDCYLCKDNKFLLQDLNEEGYRVIPMNEFLTPDHVKLAFKALATYHGLSLVLVEQNKLDRARIPPNILLSKPVFVTNLYGTILHRLPAIMKKDWGPEWLPVAEKLLATGEDIEEKLKQIVLATMNGKCSGLVHGDFTIRNIMFKHGEDNKTPINAKLIDFQGCSWSSLAMDISTLLSTSMNPRVREDNLESLLETYTTSLQETCRYYGYSGQLITLDDVKKALHAVGLFSMIQTLFVIPAFSQTDDWNLDAIVDEKAGGLPFNEAMFNVPAVRDSIQFQLKVSMKEGIL